LACGVLSNGIVRGSVFACLGLLSATAGMAATSGFLLGIDFSAGPTYGNGMATDNSGALYFLGGCPAPSTSACATKLAADGTTIVWQHVVGDFADAIAVDPNGGVYFTAPDNSTPGLFYVKKLSADGSAIAWTVPVAWGAFGPPYLTVDSTGRAYVAYGELDQTYVVRVSADGSGRDYMVHFDGAPAGIAADSTGSAIVEVTTPGGNSVMRLSADGGSQIYSIPVVGYPTALAADAGGNVAVVADNTLERFNPQGEQTFSQKLPGLNSFRAGYTQVRAIPAMAMDAAGNMYVVAAWLAHSVKNSLVTCAGATSLLVYGPDGSLLQSTYLPATPFPQYPVVAPGPGVVYIIPEDGTLMRLSQNSAAQPVPLACVANAASYFDGAVAPGEIVALFGNGLGPQQGIQTQATLQTPFPTQAGNVTVTFDGTPAPLLWVQEGQINAVVPWGLTPGQNTSICVLNNSVTTNCLTQPVAQTIPGVFTVDGYFAAALNQDGTVNSPATPAPPYSEITFYATGLGPLTPVQPDGSLVNLPLPVNVLPVSVEGDQRPDQVFGWLVVDYAGPAPFELAGVTQINCHLTQSVPPPPSFVDAGDAGSNLFGIHVAVP
jgi:uncharacterized protein (TIGR03437 family)